MGRRTYFRVYPSAVPDAVCDALIEAAAGLKTRAAELLTLNRPDLKGNVRDDAVRRTTLSFFDEGHWSCGLMMHYAELANWETWRYDLRCMSPPQFGSYGRKGHYDWHVDEFDEPHGRLAPERWVGLNRKISVVLNLSRPADYRGGQLALRDPWGNELAIEGSRERGTVVVFPAYVLHTVKPVTRGTRRSLVGWALGPNFR